MRPGLSMEVTIDHNMCVPESCCPRLYPLSMLSVYRRAGALVKRYHKGLLGAPWASPPPRLNVVLSSPRRYAVLIIRLWQPRCARMVVSTSRGTPAKEHAALTPLWLIVSYTLVASKKTWKLLLPVLRACHWVVHARSVAHSGAPPCMKPNTLSAISPLSCSTCIIRAFRMLSTILKIGSRRVIGLIL
jgi:hypothetical protein